MSSIKDFFSFTNMKKIIMIYVYFTKFPYKIQRTHEKTMNIIEVLVSEETIDFT